MGIRERSGEAVVRFCDHLQWSPSLVFQAGVGLGGELTPMLKAWPDCRYVGCEPHPRIFENWVGRYPGELHQLALGECAEIRSLNCKRGHMDGSSLFTFTEAEFDQVEVKQLPLRNFGPQLKGEEVLLWLDCEGAELDVLRGAAPAIHSVKMVNVEMTGIPPALGWCSPLSVHRMLCELGFFRMWQHTNRSVRGQYDAIYVRRDLFRPEYCSAPEEIERWKFESL